MSYQGDRLKRRLNAAFERLARMGRESPGGQPSLIVRPTSGGPDVYLATIVHAECDEEEGAAVTLHDTGDEVAVVSLKGGLPVEGECYLATLVAGRLVIE